MPMLKKWIYMYWYVLTEHHDSLEKDTIESDEDDDDKGEFYI